MSWRHLDVDGEIWRWQVGRSNVVARNGKTRSLVIAIPVLLGLTWPDWERLKWKSPSGSLGRIQPAQVVDWIRRSSTSKE